MASLKQGLRASFLHIPQFNRGLTKTMRVVGTDISAYITLSLKTKKAPSIADEKIQTMTNTGPKAPAVRTDQELVADFHSRMAKQALDWADTNKDGAVTKAEYMAGQARLSALNGKPNDQAANERRWTMLDPTGKGSLSETEIRGSLEKIFPVTVGHLTADYAERLRNPQK